MTLPAPFQGAIAAWLDAEARGGIRREAAALTATYRAGGHSADIDLASYLVARLPATYAAVSRVLAEAAALRPGLAPASLLDAGSGPGTASWAAAELWPGLEHITFLDSTPAFLKLATALAASGPGPLKHADGRGGRHRDHGGSARCRSRGGRLCAGGDSAVAHRCRRSAALGGEPLHAGDRGARNARRLRPHPRGAGGVACAGGPCRLRLAPMRTAAPSPGRTGAISA